MNVSPLTIRRLRNFRANKRGYYSALIFSVLFLISIFAEFIANDKPIFVVFDSQIHFPVFEKISETYYGGEFETEADYKDPFVRDLIDKKGFSVMPLIEYSYDTINYDLKVPSPSPPTFENLLGTDDQGRDVLARLIYGFRISVFFGLTLQSYQVLLVFLQEEFRDFMVAKSIYLVKDSLKFGQAYRYYIYLLSFLVL